MGDFKHDELSGSVFKNGFKEKDNQPDYTGSCMIDGKEYRIAGWKNKIKSGPKAGDTFLGLRFSEVDSFDTVKKTPASESPMEDDFDDDIPF